jgi:hypothetical protein
MECVADDLMSAPVEGLNLTPGSLADQFGEGGVLLFFLRHLG